MMFDAAAGHSEFRCGPLGRAYNEAAFRYFLAVDRSRARQSKRLLYLVLVAVRAGVGRRARLTNATAAALFRGLGASVREVDFVGWFYEGYVVAAVLFQGGKMHDGAPVAIADRVRAALAIERAVPQPDQMRVRVIRLGRDIGI
jgi:hypothetical protein